MATRKLSPPNTYVPSAEDLLSGRMTLCMGCGYEARHRGRMCGRITCAYTDMLPVLRLAPWAGSTTAQVLAWARGFPGIRTQQTA